MKVLLFCLVFLTGCKIQNPPPVHYELIIFGKVVVCEKENIYNYGVTLADCQTVLAGHKIHDINQATNYITVSKDGIY